MKKTRHSTEQIMAKLREAEVVMRHSTVRVAIMFVFAVAVFGCVVRGTSDVVPGRRVHVTIGHIQDGVIGGGLGRDVDLWRIDSLALTPRPIQGAATTTSDWTVSDVRYDSHKWELSNVYVTGSVSPHKYDIEVSFVVDKNALLYGKTLLLHVTASVSYVKPEVPQYQEVIAGVHGFESSAHLREAVQTIDRDVELHVLPK